jgi:2-phosphosulfolactate phosphatase
MEIYRVEREEAGTARGIVVVIDVIRAFSVAAYALAGGADRLWLVQSADEALALRQTAPEALLAGEVGGRLIPGFDLNNSPARMAGADVRGRLIIQCTGAGTRGACGATEATHLLVCSLVNARATAGAVRRLAAESNEPVTLIPTYRLENRDAGEDDLCADYLEALLTAPDDAEDRLHEALDRFRASGRLDLFREGDTDFPLEDIPAVLAVNRFDFVMPGQRRHKNGVDFVEVRRAPPVVHGSH